MCAWSGGNYTKGNNGTGGWAGDAAAGIGIEAGRHDTQDNDFATGINQCLNKDGSNSATGNLNLGGFKVSNVANGVASGDAVTLGQAQAGIDQSTTTTNFNITKFSADTDGRYVTLQKSRGATVGTNTIVQSGDVVGGVVFAGANGTGYTQAAAILGTVDGTPGATNDMPGRLSFRTTLDGAGATTERMVIKNDGKVGIGTTSPTALLQVGDGTGSKTIVVNGANTGTGGGSFVSAQVGGVAVAALGNYSGIIGGAYDGTPTLYFNTGPRVTNIAAGAGTNAMKWNTGTSAWTYDTSSLRYKKDVRDSIYGLDAVLAMQSRQFAYKDDSREDVGFIAEEMVSVVPELVTKNADGLPDAVSYDRVTSVLCKAIQELHAKVEALEDRVAALEA